MRYAGLVLAGLAFPLLAENWKLQYSYDRDEARFNIVDFTFASERRGIAVGHLTSKAIPKPSPYAIVTADGGKTWADVKLPALPLSIFFLDDTRGWLVSDKSLWKTEESGRSWQKVKAAPGALRVHFLDEKHGFAVGLNKMVLETKDGGESWTKVATAAEPASKPENTAYVWISFIAKRAGMIVGQSAPPRREEQRDLPNWFDPETAAKRRQIPNLTITLDTSDAGATWRSQTVPAFGTPTRVRTTPSGKLGLILFRFDRSFEYPSEAYWLEPGGSSKSGFRSPERMVTDLGFLGESTALLAAIEPATKLHTLPVPGKLRMIRSDNRGPWREMKVDYRASGTSAILSVADDRHAWVALDTGMILKLEP